MRTALLRFLPLVLACCAFLPATAQDTTGVERTFKPARPVDLIVAHRYIITLRAEVFGNAPEQRVANIQKHLENVLLHEGPGLLRDTAMFGGRAILIDGKPLLFITQLDIDPTQGEQMDAVAHQSLERLRVALGAYREMRDSRAMAVNIVVIVIYTVLFIAALFLLGRLRRLIGNRMERIVMRGIERTGLKGQMQRHRPLLSIARWFAMASMTVLMAVAAYFWLTGVLGRIPLTRPWGEQMYGLLARTGWWLLDRIMGALPGLGMVLLILLITRWVVRMISSVLDGIQRGEFELSWIDASVAAPTKRVATILLWLFAIVIAYPYIPGSDSKAFQGVSVLAGLMLSLGSSGVVAQAASGLVIMFNRLVRVGECVSIGDEVTGVVKRIGYFNTLVETGYKQEVTVPNSALVSSTIVNLSRHGGKGIMYTTSVTIGYDAPWRQVHAMLLEAAAATPGIAREPVPVVNQHALSDFFVDYRLTLVVDGPFRATLTALHAAIQDVFNENGVQIMSPHYEGDPEGPAKTVPRERRDPGIKKP